MHLQWTGKRPAVENNLSLTTADSFEQPVGPQEAVKGPGGCIIQVVAVTQCLGLFGVAKHLSEQIFLLQGFLLQLAWPQMQWT